MNDLDEEIELDNIVLVENQLDLEHQPAGVYLGKGHGKLKFVHLVFDTKKEAQEAAKELQVKKDIQAANPDGSKRPINVNQYGLNVKDTSKNLNLNGKYYCRIFSPDFEKNFGVDLSILSVRPDIMDKQRNNQRSSSCFIL